MILLRLHFAFVKPRKFDFFKGFWKAEKYERIKEVLKSKKNFVI